VSVALRQTFATSLAWLHERYSKGVVRSYEVIVGSPALQMGEQRWGLLRRCPGATSQCGYPMADGQIHPLDESGVQPSREA
jgi:hypothetical protein